VRAKEKWGEFADISSSGFLSTWISILEGERVPNVGALPLYLAEEEKSEAQPRQCCCITAKSKGVMMTRWYMGEKFCHL
jgi:hypothetical protein